MQIHQFISILTLLAISTASATTIETADGNTYDVQAGAPLSPYTALLSSQEAPDRPGPNAFEFRELRYQTKIPLTQMERVRAEAIDVFDRYHEAIGKDYHEEVREAIKEQRLISMFILVGTGPTKTKVRGVKNGETFEQRVTPHYYIAVFNPAGRQFSPMTYQATEYWIEKDAKSLALPFFREEMSPDGLNPYLDEILGVRDSDNWIAFSISDMRKEHVDLWMHVLNTGTLVRRELIKGAIRTDLRHQDTIQSYSVHPSDGNSIICFNTTAGMVEYDAKANTLSTPKHSDTSHSKCP